MCKIKFYPEKTWRHVVEMEEKNPFITDLGLDGSQGASDSGRLIPE